MKTHNLIEKLKTLPQDHEVVLVDENGLIWKFETKKHIRVKDGDVILGNKNLNKVY
jgi:hypothetical protein